jgi:dihydroneopterin aldolase
MKTKITLEAMKFRAFHGVTDGERIIGGTFLADISYTIETDAVETDRIEDTVSYAAMYDLIKEEMAKPSRLIEHVAGRIMKAVKRKFPQIPEITVRISKLNPPVSGEAGKATVTIGSISC